MKAVSTGVRKIVLVLGKGEGVAARVLLLIASEAQRGFKNFELHVFTARERPDYMEAVREVILSNIAYGLRIWYHGGDISRLRRLMSSNPKPALVIDETAERRLVEEAKRLKGD